MEHLEFQIISSSNYCESVFDGTHDSPKYHNDGYHLVTSKHLDGNNIKIDEAPFITKEDFDKINERSLIKQNDVLVSMIGTVGTISFIKENPNFAIKNIGVLRAKTELDAKYLYYFMQSSTAQNEIKSSLVGSTQPFLSLAKLREFPLKIVTTTLAKQHIVNTILSHFFF